MIFSHWHDLPIDISNSHKALHYYLSTYIVTNVKNEKPNI